jgi:hypothetical protein
MVFIIASDHFIAHINHDGIPFPLKITLTLTNISASSFAFPNN